MFVVVIASCGHTETARLIGPLTFPFTSLSRCPSRKETIEQHGSIHPGSAHNVSSSTFLRAAHHFHVTIPSAAELIVYYHMHCVQTEHNASGHFFVLGSNIARDI